MNLRAAEQFAALCWCHLRVGKTWTLPQPHCLQKRAHINKHTCHPSVRTVKFDWWGNRWEIAVSVLMDDIIWPNVLIMYAELEPCLPPPVPPFCLQLISGSFVHQPPLNLMHEEGEQLTQLFTACPNPLPPPPSFPLPHSSLSRGVQAMTDPVALCLFSLICRQSLCVKWPFCF